MPFDHFGIITDHFLDKLGERLLRVVICREATLFDGAGLRIFQNFFAAANAIF